MSQSVVNIIIPAKSMNHLNKIMPPLTTHTAFYGIKPPTRTNNVSFTD